METRRKLHTSLKNDLSDNDSKYSKERNNLTNEEEINLIQLF